MRLLFVGTYTTKEGHVDGKSKGIYVYRIPGANKVPKSKADFELVEVVEQLNPSFLIVSSNKKWLFSVTETGGDPKLNTVSAYRIEDADVGKHLSLRQTISSDGIMPCYLEEHNGYLLASNYMSGSVVCYRIDYDNDPVLTHASTTQFTGHSAVDPARQEGPHAHCTLVLSEINKVIVSDLGADKLRILDLLPGGQGLSDTSKCIQLDAGCGPRHLVLSPCRRRVYAICELSSQICSFDYLPMDPEHFLKQTNQPISTVFGDLDESAEGDYPFQNCADIHLTNCGRYLYGSNRGELNSVAAYQVNDTNGALAPIGCYSVNGLVPRNFAISPEDDYLLVGKQDSHNILPFKIDRKTGKLTPFEFEIDCLNPVCLKIVDF